MSTYDSRAVRTVFASIERRTFAAAATSMQQLTLNKEPALLTFDETETNTVAYTEIRNKQITANVVISTQSALPVSALYPEAEQQLMQEYVTHFRRNLKGGT